MRKLVSVAALLAVALTLLPGAAKTQVPQRQGFFGHLDGRWMWLGGDRINTSLGSASQISNGPGGQMMLGYRVGDNWDYSLAGDIQQMFTQTIQINGGTLRTDVNHQHVDAELGYTLNPQWRVNFGLRGVHYRAGVTYYSAVNSGGFVTREIWGAGPKIGLGGRIPLSDNFAVVGAVNAALVFAGFNDIGTGIGMANGNFTQLTPQADIEAGISYRSADRPHVSFTVGARLQAWFNTAISGYGASGTVLEYGPFVRAAYNF
jgi:hypothetical protein